MVYLLLLMSIAVCGLLFDSRRKLALSKAARRSRQVQQNRLVLVLKTGKLRLWVYTPANRHYYYLSDDGTTESEYNPIEFSQLFDRDDFEDLRTAIFDLCEHKRQSAVVSLRGLPDSEQRRRYYEVSVSILQDDARGNVIKVLGIEHDRTDDVVKQQTVNELLMRYHTVFNTSLVDMIYYDANGVLRDINERACQTFGVSRQQMVSEGHFLLQNNPFFHNVDLESLENTQTSCIFDYAQYTDPVYRLDELGLKGKMYYESTINPIHNSDGKLEGIFMAGRDVTEMVDSYHQLQRGIRNLQQATDDVQQYVSNINYALRVTGVRLVNYNPRTYTFKVSDNIGNRQFQLSQLRCIRLATPRFRRNVSSMLNRMDHLTRYPISETIETEFRDEKHRQVWLLLSLVPLLDAEGKVERYFGMLRNMTDMVETERKLAVETRKAQETELLKQAFLTNMSYEIRTPLNTVVGFAELLEREHDPADEPFFVDQIKKSSNDLLLLINDILFLSRLDASMIEYVKSDIDFALVFESHCQMGWSMVKPGVSVSVDNPYQSLVLNIDEEHVGKVIEKACALSAAYTMEGSVTAKCEYRRGELTITIEDTGVGFAPSALPHIFERFSRDDQQRLCGTGLDMPIIQSLVQQMGGTVEIESQVGSGTTLWIAIPCEARQVVRRMDNTSNNLESLMSL